MWYQNIGSGFFYFVTKQPCDRQINGQTNEQNLDPQYRASIAASRGKNWCMTSPYVSRHRILMKCFSMAIYGLCITGLGLTAVVVQMWVIFGCYFSCNCFRKRSWNWVNITFALNSWRPTNTQTNCRRLVRLTQLLIAFSGTLQLHCKFRYSHKMLSVVVCSLSVWDTRVLWQNGWS